MIFLVDNGSIRAAAYVNLCGIAKDLSIAIEEMVTPAPLLHANKIPPDELENESPHLLEELLADAYDRGLRDFTVLPLSRPSRIFSKNISTISFASRLFNPTSSKRVFASSALVTVIASSSNLTPECTPQVFPDRLDYLVDLSVNLSVGKIAGSGLQSQSK